MNREDQVFVANVVVTDPTRKMVVMNVIDWPIGAIAELNTIAKIRKYRKFHEWHHFILMAMEVHGTPKCDMDHSIKECACLFHNKWWMGHLSLFFYIQAFRQRVNIILQCALTSTIVRKITLAKDVCSKPPIIIRFHDLQCKQH
jgi:hypothetical protein